MSRLFLDQPVTDPDSELGDCRRETAEAKDEPEPRRAPTVEQIERQQNDAGKVTQHR